MMEVTNIQEGQPQQSNPDLSTVLHNQSIRFSFPDRPFDQDHFYGCNLRTLDNDSNMENQHCQWAEFPFFIASFFSVVSTFVSVRAIAVSGYVVDHASWDGTGHHYDQHGMVFLSTPETSLLSLSLICGLITCLLLILRVLVYSGPLFSYCPFFAFINASCLLSTCILFYQRTHALVETSTYLVYSRGFYSCTASGVMSLVAFGGFLLDWLLDSPARGPLSIIMKTMIVPSVLYCFILITGTLVFIQLEGWEYSEAMMFCATSLTTIGYGDVVPRTSAGRLFFLAYATVGIGVVGYFLLSLRTVMISGSSANLMIKVNLMRVESLQKITRSHRQRQRQRQRLSFRPALQNQCQQRTTNCVETTDATVAPGSPLTRRVGDSPAMTQQQLFQHRSIGGLSTFSNYTLANVLNEEFREKWIHIVTYSGVSHMAIILILCWFGGAAVFCRLEENWTYLDALYFAFATQLTIGFGDLVPQSAAAQEFWFVYIIISIAVAAYFISMLGDILAEKLLINNGMDDGSVSNSKGGGYGDDDDGEDINGDGDGEIGSYTDINDLTDGTDPSKHDQISINLFPETSNDHMNNVDIPETQSTILFGGTQQRINAQDNRLPTITPIVHHSRTFDYGAMDHRHRQQTGNDYTAWNKNNKRPLTLAITDLPENSAPLYLPLSLPLPLHSTLGKKLRSSNEYLSTTTTPLYITCLMASSFNHVTYQPLPSSPSSSSQADMSSIKKKDPELEEILDDQLPSASFEHEPAKATFFVYVLVFCVCVGGFLFGYDTGVISGALQPIEDEFHLGTVEKELVVGATTFGAIFGGFFAGMYSDKFGRKLLILFASAVFIVGALLLALAPNFACLLVGRLVVGLGVGVASMIVPVFISEIAPKNIRGRLTTLNTLVITFGQVIAYVINIAFSNVDQGWRYMFGIAGIPALFQLVVMPFLPESPRHLIINGRKDDARKVIRKIYGNSVSDAFIDNEIDIISDDISTSRAGHFKDFKLAEHYKPLIIACILQAAQQLSGFNAAMYYAATILQMAGFRSNQGSTSVAIIVAATNLVFTMVAVFVIDRVGRRKMLVVTMLTMIAGLIALGATFGVQQGFIPKQDTCGGYATHCARCVIDPDCGWSSSQDTCVVTKGHDPSDIFASPTGCPPRSNDHAFTGILITALIVYVASYALGLGYAPWLIQSEIFTTAMRGKANGISTAVNWICNLIVSTTFLSMTDSITTGGTYFFYAGVSLVLYILIYFLVPETANSTLEELHKAFIK